MHGCFIISAMPIQHIDYRRIFIQDDTNDSWGSIKNLEVFSLMHDDNMYT